MRTFLLAVLCAVALKDVVAEGENEVKRGRFAFMTFVYYPGEAVIENGARFTRSAVLITNDWLISSIDVAIAFPQETLLARVGAVKIDKNFTLNEDEYEQEREIIMILRPYNFSATQWWKTDISVMKTLLPFKTTTSVAPATLVNNTDFSEKYCFILLYVKRDNGTERTLIQKNVELLQPNLDVCGNYFEKDTMVCAADGDKNVSVDPHFCQGNRGGPLVCDNEITGLQTYINDCKQPHLYQLVHSWKKLISCAIEQRYLTQSCADVSIVIPKDPLSTPEVALQRYSQPIVKLMTEETNMESVGSESAYAIQQSTDTTEPTPPAKVEEQKPPTLTTETESIPVGMIVIDEQSTTTKNISTLIEKLSFGTTTTEVTYHTVVETVMDSANEHDSKTKINTQHQLTAAGTSQKNLSLFLYIVISITVLPLFVD